MSETDFDSWDDCCYHVCCGSQLVNRLINYLSQYDVNRCPAAGQYFEELNVPTFRQAVYVLLRMF